MNKLLALLSVYHKGSIVANPTAWKNGQITASMLAGLLGAVIALAKTFGYSLPLSDDQLLTIGGSIIAVAGLFLNPTATIVSSDKVGLPSSDNPPDKQVSPLTGY
jgi:hypothetical protein